MTHIFIHGLGQTPESWDRVLTDLSKVKDCVCPDLSELLRGSEATYENIYKAFTDVCNGTKGVIDLCGLSLGSVLALNYTIDHPEKVASLVLIAPQFKMPAKLLRFQNAVFRLMPKSMFQKNGFEKHDFIQLCKSMMSLDFSKSLMEVSCPALIICGEQDAANKKASVELAGILKNAELQMIKEAGHEVNVESPKALAELLDTFFAV